MTDLQRLEAAMRAAGCDLPEGLLMNWGSPKWINRKSKAQISLTDQAAIAMICGDEEVARWLSKRQHYIQPKRNHGELWEMLEPAPHERRTWKRTLFSTRCRAYTAAFEHIAGRRADA